MISDDRVGLSYASTYLSPQLMSKGKWHIFWSENVELGELGRGKNRKISSLKVTS